MEGETICIGHLPVTWDFCELTTVCSYDRESYLGLVFLISFFFCLEEHEGLCCRDVFPIKKKNILVLMSQLVCSLCNSFG